MRRDHCGRDDRRRRGRSAPSAAIAREHEANTHREATALVADRGYGTVDTYCTLIEQGVRPHMTPMLPADHKSEGLFTKDAFRYDEKADV